MSECIIKSIDLWACSVPLPSPIDFGSFEISSRHHVAMRMTTTDGMVADVLGHTRGSPLDVIAAEVIAPHLVGRSALDVESRRVEVGSVLTALERDGAIGRAWALAEICLHDLRAQAVGWPLWRLLGGRPGEVAVALVEGYALSGEDDEGFATRLARRADEGFSLLKIEAGHYADEELLRRLTLTRRAVDARVGLVLDFAWSWQSAHGKADLLRRLEDVGVAWLEDCFERTRVDAYRDLQASTNIAIGVGDETTRPADLIALMNAGVVDVVRLDATTNGGIEAARELALQAREKGLRPSFHVHPELHEHLVFGFESADHVEIFPTDRPFDQEHRLIEQSAFDRIVDGKLSSSMTPGTGMRLREDGLTQLAHRHERVDA